jgi:predicted permease
MLTWLGVDPIARATVTLLAACPTAVNVFIQTRALDVFARGAAQAVIAGTILSLLSLTVLAHFLT